MKLTFFGQSAWGLEGTDGHRILVDPYPISPEAESLLTQYANDHLSHVLVTHAGFDHLGIALQLIQQLPESRLVADVAVVRHAIRSGVSPERIDVIGWNKEMAAGPWHFRALEAKHASVIESVDGDYVTGMPLGFLIRHAAEEEVRVMHLGDTSIFSDLTLFGQLYHPMIAIINVYGAMTASEAALAAFWMGVDIALPTHFTREPEAADAFCGAVLHLPRQVRAWVPEIGVTYIVQRETKISSQGWR